MLPERVHYQSIATIASKISSAGFNMIRLTCDSKIIDLIYENGGANVSMSTAPVTALGDDNGTKVLQVAISDNPSFNKSTLRGWKYLCSCLRLRE